jgi:hypothetical protein
MQNSPFNQMGRAIMAEQQRTPNPQQQPSPAQQAGLVSLDSLLRMQAQLNYLRNATPQKPVPQGTVAQDMQQQIQQQVADKIQQHMAHNQPRGLEALPAENIGNEQAYASGGIVAFGNPILNPDEDQLVKRVAGESAATNESLGRGALGFLQNAGEMFVSPVGHALNRFRKLLKKDPDTGRYYIGDRPEHTYRTDKEAWADYYKNNQGILSGVAPSAEDLAAASKTMRVQGAPRIAPENTPAALSNATDWQSNLGNFGPTTLEDRPKFAMGPQTGLQGIPVNKDTADQSSAPPAPTTPSAGLGATPEAQGNIADLFKVPTLAERLEEIRKAKGPNTAGTEYAKYLDELKASGKATLEEDKRNALARAGFAMAAAASRPGQAGSEFSKLLGAAAAGGESYATALPEINKNMRALNQKIAEDQWKLRDAERRENAEDIKTAAGEVNTDRRDIMHLQVQKMISDTSERNANLRAQIQARGLDQQADKQLKAIEAQLRGQDENTKRTLLGSLMNSARAETIQASKDVANAFDPVGKKAAQTALDEAHAREYAISSLLLSGLGLPTNSIPVSDAAKMEAEAKRRGFSLTGK